MTTVYFETPFLIITGPDQTRRTHHHPTVHPHNIHKTAPQYHSTCFSFFFQNVCPIFKTPAKPVRWHGDASLVSRDWFGNIESPSPVEQN